MIVFERKIESEKTESKIGKKAIKCQASFNSDGRIVLRSYANASQAKDEVICLTEKETEAIIELFQVMSRKITNTSGYLPF